MKANDVPLVVINQVTPVFVNFAAPEQHLATIRRLSAGRKLPVSVLRNDNAGRTAQGSLSLIDNAVDSNTGTIRLKATFDNKDGMLWPGQFVTVVLTLDTRRSDGRPGRGRAERAAGAVRVRGEAGQSRGDPAGNGGARVRQQDGHR